MSASPDVLHGRYRLDNVIGRGGFARVYLATDLRLKRQVAVKVLSLDLIEPGTERDFRARFEREAQAVAALDHPNILGIHDYGETTENVYLVMPYVAGGSLADRLRRTGHFPLEEAARYVRQVAAALDYAHAQGIVHRDLKPQNLMLTGSGDRLLLADFGIAKLLRESTSTYSQSKIVGTVAYMAPEQWRGQALPATDIYALGCLLFQLLTGRVPYGGNAEETMYGHMMEPIPSVVERSDGRVPTAVQSVIERALAKRVEGRFASAGQLAAALDSAATAPGRYPDTSRATAAGFAAAIRSAHGDSSSCRASAARATAPSRPTATNVATDRATPTAACNHRDNVHYPGQSWSGWREHPATTALFSLARPSHCPPRAARNLSVSAAPTPTALQSAAPTNAVSVTAPALPRSSSAGPPVSGTAMTTPTPTNITSSTGSSAGITSISGTFTFSGGLPPTSGEWGDRRLPGRRLRRVAIGHAAADGRGARRAHADLTTTVAVSGTQPFAYTYNVGGSGKGAAVKSGQSLVLRRKTDGATTMALP
ncbi:MAG: protein kinase [Chloroflexia bacterium]